MWPATSLLTGLAAGSIHVATGPDHLAAVAPLAVDGRRTAWRTGLMWGVGHSTGTWVLATIALIFCESIPVTAISGWSERLVGVVLIAVELWSLRRALHARIHIHQHTHDACTHSHIHAHAHPHPDHDHATRPHTHTHGALGIGTLHGLAGTSHLVGILPALALPTRSSAVVYVLAFGLGSIVAMTIFAAACGLLSVREANRSGHLFRSLRLALSTLAIVLGGFWIFSAA